MEKPDAEELEWLTWFARNADFGPGHGDVAAAMEEQMDVLAVYGIVSIDYGKAP